MQNKTKNYTLCGILIFVTFLIALPTIVNTKVAISLKTSNISLNGNIGYYTSSEDTCNKDQCSNSQCINSENLPEDINNYKICFCCINFEFKEDKNTKEKFWKVKDYQVKIFYQEGGKEQEKTFVNSNPFDEILLPNFKNKYISLTPDYSKPYYYDGKYPDELKVNLHRIKFSWRKVLEFIISQS